MAPRKESKGEREAAKAASGAAKAAADAEDAAWREAGDGAKGKAAKKRDDADAERAAAAAKKAEAKKLAEAEEREMASLGKKGGKVAPPKVTVAQLAAAAEAEKAARERAAEQMKKAARKEVSEDAYAGLVSNRNMNREVDSVEATGLDDALVALQRLELEGEGDEGPLSPRAGGGKQKANWIAYEAANLAALQEEKPGLKRQQYKELLWKSWQKAPENPQNAAAANTPQRPRTPIDLSNAPPEQPSPN